MKGQSEAEKVAILAAAGNPKNGQVQPLTSVPHGFRILQRTYSYSKEKKRGVDALKTIGMVVDGQFMTREEYHRKYTWKGRRRPVMPQGQPPSRDREQTDVSAVPRGTVYQRLTGAVPILYRIARDIGLTDDLRDAYGIDVAAEMLSLAMHWIHDRDNAARRYASFAEVFALPFPGIMDEKSLAQLYGALGRDEAALSRLFTARCSRLSPGARVCYDSTSIPTAGADLYWQETSRLKEGTFGPMMHLALLTDQQSGQPLRYRLFAGKTPEDLIKCLEELTDPADKLCTVFDRGYETLANLTLCAASGKAVLMAVRDLRQEFVQQAIDAYSDYWDAGACLPGTTVQGHTRPYTFTSAGRQLTWWVHVFRDDGKSKFETAVFMRELEQFEAAWQQADFVGRSRLVTAPAARYFTWSMADGRLERDTDAINAATRNFGFFANVSTVEMTAVEALSAYRRRDGIEKCFKSGKLNFNLDVVRAHGQETMKGRFVISFIVLIILAELNRRLGCECRFADGRRKSIPARTFSLTDLLGITRGVTANYAEQTGAFWYQGKSEKLERLCRACGAAGVYDGLPVYLTSGRELYSRWRFLYT